LFSPKCDRKTPQLYRKVKKRFAKVKTNRSCKGKTFGRGNGLFGPGSPGQLQIRVGNRNPQVTPISPTSGPAPHSCRRPVISTAGGMGGPWEALALRGCSRPREVSGAQGWRGASRVPRSSDLFPPAGSGGSRTGQPGEGSPRARGLAFAALKTFQRACHGEARRLRPGPRRPAPPAGNFWVFRWPVTLVGRRASPWARAAGAPSLSARTCPGAGGSRARSALALPAPPPPGFPAPCVSTWPGRAPHPERLEPPGGPWSGQAGKGGGDPPPGGVGGGGLAAGSRPTFRQWSRTTCPSRLPQRRRRWRRRSRWNCWRTRLPRGRSERPHR